MTTLYLLWLLFFQVNDIGNSNVPIEKINSNGYKALVYSIQQVTFVNFWATWCQPCVEEFPDIVLLSEKYPDVRFITISIDEVEELESKVKPFIAKSGAKFEQYIMDDVAETFINQVNPKWSGAIPATMIYQQNGLERTFLLGKKTFEEFEIAIEKFINP